MNARIAILAVALVLAIAAMVHLKRTAAGLPASTNPSGGTATPSKIERIDGNHHPDRFRGLDPSLHQLVVRLEDLNLTWERNRSPELSSHTLWNNWRMFALNEAAQLESSDIEALIVWLDEMDHTYVTEVVEYRQAFFQTWASRDPEAAREHVLALAEQCDLFSSEERQQWHDVSLGEVCDDYHFVLAGSATLDPAKAWTAFQQDLADPMLKILTDVSSTVPEIFSAYAAQAPEEAWNIVLNHGERKILQRMLEGYADGAPAGQDWNAMGTALLETMHSRNIEPDHRTYEAIAARWVTEDPAAALDWYAARATLYDNDPDDPFAPDIPVAPKDLPPPEELQQRLKIDLLESMNASHRDLTNEVVTALDRLLANDETEFVTAALSELTGGGHLAPWGTPFLDLVPRIPDPEIRNATFLQFVEVLARSEIDPFSPVPFLEGRRIACEAVRKLAGQLDLPDDLRAKAEATFREIEEEEELARAELRDGPFANE